MTRKCIRSAGLIVLFAALGCTNQPMPDQAVSSKSASTQSEWEQEFALDDWRELGLSYVEPAPAKPASDRSTRSASEQSTEIRRFIGHQSKITSIHFSPNSKQAVSTSDDGTVRVWEIDSGKELRKYSQLGAKPRAVIISPDATRLAVAGDDKFIHVFGLADEKELFTLRAHKAPIYWLTMSNDGRFLASVDIEGAIFVWTMAADGPPAERRLAFGFRRRGERIYPIFSRDGTRLYTIFDCQHLISWSTDTWQRNEESQFFKAAPNAHLAVIPKNGLIGLATKRTLRLLYPNPRAQQGVPPALAGQPGFGAWVETPPLVTSLRSIHCLSTLGGGTILVAVEGDGSIEYWRPERNESAGQYPLETKGITAVAFDPWAYRSLTGHEDGSLVLHQLPNPKWYAEEIASSTGYDVLMMLKHGEYDKLEETIERYRREQTTFETGDLAAEFFYDCLSRPRTENDDWQTHFNEIAGWQRAKPKSIAARLAQAASLLERGWDERGRGFADTVTVEGWESFRSQLTQATKVLEEAAQLQETDSHLYCLQIDVSKGLNAPRESIDKSFRDGQKLNPFYYPLYESMAEYLLPRWHGQPGEVTAWAKEVCDSLPERGDEVYARIACGLASYECEDFFGPLEFDYERILRGFKSMKVDYTKSQRFLNCAAFFACLRLDLGTARPLLQAIGNNWLADVWRNQRRFRAWQAWANLNVRPGKDQKTILAHAYLLSAIHHSGNGRLLISVSADSHSPIKVWDATNGYRQLMALPKLQMPVRDAVLHPTLPIVAIAAGTSPNSALRRASVDLRTGRPLLDANADNSDGYLMMCSLNDWSSAIVLHEGATDFARYSADGSILAAACRDRALRVWNLAKRGEPRELQLSEEADDLAISPDGTMAAVRLHTSVQIIDITSGGKLGEIKGLGQGRSGGIHFSPDGSLLCVTNERSGAVLWEVQAKKEHATFGAGESQTSAAAFSIDGKWLATGDTKGVVWLWNVANGQQLGRYEGHWSMITGLCFAQDNRTLVSSAVDGAIKLWDLSEQFEKSN